MNRNPGPKCFFYIIYIEQHIDWYIEGSTNYQTRSTDNAMIYTVHDVFPITEYIGDTFSVNKDGKNTKTDTYTFENKRKYILQSNKFLCEIRALFIC